MEIAIDVLNYVLAALMIGVAAAWVFFLKSMLNSFAKTPYLDRYESKPHDKPKVSIILPARNEEEFIEKCLDSLIDQNYENYEIIAIDDSSEDETGKIIKKYSEENSKVIHVKARAKPDGWMGKNWACMEGYKKATGELLLFTDADTKHSNNTISLAVSHLLSLDLDVLTVIPKMLCIDFWTSVTLPMISTFLHTRFSALRVNDPSKKTGYFFGSFFIIKKQVYDKVGTHEGVKHEIIEDGALGRIVKESGYKMRMVRGEHLIEAVWARDFSSLWNALKRLMVPMYLQNSTIGVSIFFAVLFLLFMPFPILIYSISFLNTLDSFTYLFVTSAIASILIYAGSITETKKGLQLKASYAILAPVGGFMVAIGFLSGILQAKRDSSILWRNRHYTLKDHVQKSITV